MKIFNKLHAIETGINIVCYRPLINKAVSKYRNGLNKPTFSLQLKCKHLENKCGL